MRIAVVIPTLNAVKRGVWREVLNAVAAQTVAIERKIILDSASDDATCAEGAAQQWECYTIERKQFNHGLTRGKIVRELAETGIDTVVFLSQDVILKEPDALKKLTAFLWSNPVAGCYGKQCSRHESSLNSWQRARCYPGKSIVKTLDDVPQFGMMTPFFSDAFAAWKSAEVVRYGGFPETDFGEDMLLAARILNQHGAVGYCAESAAWHDHPESVRALFRRGVQLGVFHRRHPELRAQFGKVLLPRSGVPPFRLWLALGIKAAGYLAGKR